MKIHADDCKRACEGEFGDYMVCDTEGHASHSCTCTAQAALAELVAAAEAAIVREGTLGRLNAALKPFRGEKP